MRAPVGTLLGLTGILLLAGCVGPPGGQGGGDGSSGSGDGAGAGGREQVSCAEASSVTLDGERVAYEIVGDCAEVIVRGNGLDVRMGATTALSIDGRANEVDSGSGVGAVTIKGDDNDVEATTIASIVIAGNDNDLEAETVGSVEIKGDDNGVEAGNDPQPVRVTGDGNMVERH
ncbi:DUF3060 domain-containing protein [Agromyces sp. PvR057]|uniref:DUF3060 domain-containing protein n=1 Tax=Agromyces sp. PvR057 TaxID=3156403 RepID=UPI0033946A75